MSLELKNNSNPNCKAESKPNLKGSTTSVAEPWDFDADSVWDPDPFNVLNIILKFNYDQSSVGR